MGGKWKTFPYYDRLDGLLGTRPTVNPVALSDSLINEDEQDSDNETQENVEGMCILIYYHTNSINRLPVKLTRCRWWSMIKRVKEIKILTHYQYRRHVPVMKQFCLYACVILN